MDVFFSRHTNWQTRISNLSMFARRPYHCRHSAFTLLEVILALAILAGSIAVLGEVMSIASRSAAEAQAEAQAQMLASSVMDEMLAGVTELTNLARQPLPSDAAIPWVCTVILGDTDLVGLMSVEVVVEQDVEEQFHPVKYRLLRWLSTESESLTGGEADEESSASSSGDDSNA